MITSWVAHVDAAADAGDARRRRGLAGDGQEGLGRSSSVVRPRSITPPTSNTTMRGPLASSAALSEPGPSLASVVTRMIRAAARRPRFGRPAGRAGNGLRAEHGREQRAAPAAATSKRDPHGHADPLRRTVLDRRRHSGNSLMTPVTQKATGQGDCGNAALGREAARRQSIAADRTRCARFAVCLDTGVIGAASSERIADAARASMTMLVIARSKLRAARLLGAARWPRWPPSAPARRTPPPSAATPRRSRRGSAEGDAIVVTGFRASLERRAQRQARTRSSSVDAIVAEDIAKFPDQNLAESLQRIPGISIQRDAGEGRAITVRGLGAQFTRVRVNGMETVATSTDGAAANRDRAFDFNVFASELFNSIVVHKTAEASLDEGSLGAVVDLNTGNPLGRQVRASRSSARRRRRYNDLSENVGPRARRPGRRGNRRRHVRRLALGRLSRTPTRSSSATTPSAGRRRASTRSTARRASTPRDRTTRLEQRRHLPPERGLRSGRARLPPAHPALRRGRATTASGSA